MVSTRNTSRSHANPPRMQDQQGDIDSRPLGGTLETLQANTNEMEARQAREGQNTVTQEEQQHLDPTREADGEGETSQVKEHDPYKLPGENRNEERHGRNNRGDGPTLY